MSAIPGERHGEGTYQMLWDCKYCSTPKLLGVTHRHCPNCGAAQDPAWRYFPAEQDMVALENHQFVGADKICPACSQPNSAASTYCSECGADLATGKVAQLQAERSIGTGIAASDTRHDVVQAQFVAEMQRVGAMPGSGRIQNKGLIIASVVGGVIVLALIIAAIIFALTYRKEVSGEVTKMTWERTIDIESFEPRRDGDWDESVPGDAYNKSCQEKQRSTRQVESGSHQECKDVDQGDGSFKRECETVKEYRDEPVYDTWCDYTVDRWGYARSVKANGSGREPEPSWPTYNLSSGSGRYGKERAGAQRETYTLFVRDSDHKEHKCEFEEQSTWARYSPGTKVSLKVTIVGTPDCDTLQALK